MNKAHLEILQERLVRGEITLEQYHELVEAISNQVPAQQDNILIDKRDGRQINVSRLEAKKLIEKGDVAGDEKAKYSGANTWDKIAELIGMNVQEPTEVKDPIKPTYSRPGIEKNRSIKGITEIPTSDSVESKYATRVKQSNANNYFDKVITFFKIKTDQWILLNAFVAGSMLGSHASANTPGDATMMEYLFLSLIIGMFFAAVAFVLCLFTKNSRTLFQEKLKSKVKTGYWLLVFMVIGNFFFLVNSIVNNSGVNINGYNLNFSFWFSSFGFALVCFFAVHLKKYKFFIAIIISRHCTDFLLPGLFPVGNSLFLIVNWTLWISAINAYKLEKYFSDDSRDSIDY